MLYLVTEYCEILAGNEAFRASQKTAYLGDASRLSIAVGQAHCRRMPNSGLRRGRSGRGFAL